MSNLFTMGCCYNSSEITTKPPEMAIKSELWDINFSKCYSPRVHYYIKHFG